MKREPGITPEQPENINGTGAKFEPSVSDVLPIHNAAGLSSTLRVRADAYTPVCYGAQRYFIVDFGSVHSAGLGGVEKLNSSDAVYVFYSADVDMLSIRTFRELMAANAAVMFIERTADGDEALSCQITAFLCQLAECNIHNNTAKYYIVTRGDCNAVVEYLNKCLPHKTVRKIPELKTALYPF